MRISYETITVFKTLISIDFHAVFCIFIFWFLFAELLLTLMHYNSLFTVVYLKYLNKIPDFLKKDCHSCSIKIQEQAKPDC